MVKNKQLLVDLTVLHGWLLDREGFDPRYAQAVAEATKLLFPKATLSTAMTTELEKTSK